MKTNKKHSTNLRLYRLKRYISHPLRWTSMIAIVWPILSILIIHFTGAFLNPNGFMLFTALPSALLFGLNGFYMIQRDEYIKRSGGNIGYGFPAKLLGYIFVIFGWGGSMFLVAGVIFHWF